jgi:transposase InsO family protein
MIGEEMNMSTSVSGLARKLGMSRQNYYKGRRGRLKAEVDGALVEDLVRCERALQPRLGGRKLFKILGVTLEKADIKLGRDRFFDILREKGLLVPSLPKSPRTTRFAPCLPVFRNLVAGRELTEPNQAWAADITYIHTDEGFLYLSLITDMWSRKIVGYHVGESLETECALSALAMALSSLRCGLKPVHHSDRGCQYASHLYVEKLREAGLQISMTEELHCYENAIAERVNGILKQEYYIGSCFRNKDQAKVAVKEAVYLYNTRRPHKSLGYEMPEKMHRIAA